MFIKKIKLENFRNFKSLTLNLGSSTSLILAPNTSGKSNILEAVYYLASGHSFRADLEQELINRDRPFADIEGWIEKSEESLSLRVFFEKTEKSTNLTKKRYEVNGVSRRLGSFLGNFQAVLFTPEDLNLIIDSPAKRRRYLDTVIAQINSNYHATVIQYQRIITQRNKLLEKIRDHSATLEQLFYWNDKLLKLGKEIYEKRKEMIEYFNSEMRKIGSEIHAQGKDLEIMYFPSMLNPERLKNYQQKEIDSGQSLIGPHRDDYSFYWKGLDLEKYGSRGEQRLGILAMKIAELEYITKQSGERPVLLLDDIFSELDEIHRKKLLFLFKAQQTIITSTEDEVLTFVKDTFQIEVINLKRE